jgi:hypothetical protein
MRKLGVQTLKTPSSTPSTHHVSPDGAPSSHLHGVPDPIFLVHTAKAGGITRKEFQYGMRVSKTLVDDWFSGKKHDPLRRARDLVSLFRAGGKIWLIPSILEYIAGSEFEGSILTAEQQHALMVLAKVVK